MKGFSITCETALCKVSSPSQRDWQLGRIGKVQSEQNESEQCPKKYLGLSDRTAFAILLVVYSRLQTSQAQNRSQPPIIFQRPGSLDGCGTLGMRCSVRDVSIPKGLYSGHRPTNPVVKGSNPTTPHHRTLLSRMKTKLRRTSPAKMRITRSAVPTFVFMTRSILLLCRFDLWLLQQLLRRNRQTVVSTA